MSIYMFLLDKNSDLDDDKIRLVLNSRALVSTYPAYSAYASDSILNVNPHPIGLFGKASAEMNSAFANYKSMAYAQIAAWNAVKTVAINESNDEVDMDESVDKVVINESNDAVAMNESVDDITKI